MKSLLKYFTDNNFEIRSADISYSIWAVKQKETHKVSIYVKKKSKQYIVETAIILSSMIQTNKYNVSTIKKVLKIVEQSVR